jgi:hypothetical protein
MEVKDLLNRKRKNSHTLTHKSDIITKIFKNNKTNNKPE